MPTRRTLGFVKLRVLMINVPDRRYAPCGITFAKHQIEVGLQELLEIHPCLLCVAPWMTRLSLFEGCLGGSPRHLASDQSDALGKGVLSSCCSHR